MTRTSGPGPKYLLPPTVGLNNHDPTITRAPGYSFGSRYSYSYSQAPGPYYIESGLSNKGKDNNSGFTLHGRPKRSIWDLYASNSPGPAYSINNNITEKKTPSFTFGAPYKQNYNTYSPGPNSYTISSGWQRNSKGAIIGGRTTDLKSFSYDHAKTPGPAYYGNAFHFGTKGPSFTMGRRLKSPVSKIITPGPNMYNPVLDWTNPRSPRFSMGIRHHEDVLNVAEVSD